MPGPAVSVVVPTYQRRGRVRQAVAAALAQTFADLEVIVVDDGSTDGTDDALAGLDPRVRYEWQENRGVSAARNAGIRLARGEIVAFLDSDDRWLPEHVAVVTEVLARHPDAVLCTTSPRFHPGGRQLPSEADVVDALPSLLVENVVGCPSGIAVRREAILAAGGFDERLTVMEGWEMWLRLALHGPFALLRRRTFLYQPSRDSLSEGSARRGDYPAALAAVAASAAAVAAASARSDLRARAEGLAAYFEALRALHRGDEAGAGRALGEACALLPELSSEPQLVANRLSLLRFGPAGRLSSFGAAALLWPDPGAETALYLRAHALALAVRLDRGAEALRLLRGWPVAATPRFLVRAAPLFGRLVKRRLQGRFDALPPSSRPVYDGATTERR